jgi:hypothetical protein
MARSFSTGLSMGMDMARDIRASNLASAERRERSKYRKKADKRADEEFALREKTEKRQRRESNVRMKSLKEGMKRAKRSESRDMAMDSAKLLNENLQRQINQKKLETAKNPLINVFKEKAALLDHYKETVSAAGARHASEIGPILNRIDELQTFGGNFTEPTTGFPERRENTPELLDLMAVRDSMVNTHKDFLAGLEQAFMASSNQPHTGQVSIVPFTNKDTGKTAYNFKLEGASVTDAEAFYKKIQSMGLTTGGGGMGGGMGGMGGGGGGMGGAADFGDVISNDINNQRNQ